MRITKYRKSLSIGLVTMLSLGACDAFDREGPRMAEEEEAAAYFASHPAVQKVTARGNVVEIRVRQPADQLQRGGSLWAKVGPYIYLFSPATQELLADHPGVAAVRVLTFDAAGEEVARAMMRRDELSDTLWRRSHNLLGQALDKGTEQPSLLADLVQWGEQLAEYEYSPRYVSR